MKSKIVKKFSSGDVQVFFGDKPLVGIPAEPIHILATSFPFQPSKIRRCARQLKTFRRCVLIPMHPEQAFRIVEGKQTVHFRKQNIWTGRVDGILIYAGRPVSHVIGFVGIKKIESLPLGRAWRLHGKNSGVSKEEFDRYYAGDKIVNVVVLGRVRPIDPAYELKDFGVYKVPRRYKYVCTKKVWK